MASLPLTAVLQPGVWYNVGVAGTPADVDGVLIRLRGTGMVPDVGGSLYGPHATTAGNVALGCSYRPDDDISVRELGVGGALVAVRADHDAAHVDALTTWARGQSVIDAGSRAASTAGNVIAGAASAARVAFNTVAGGAALALSVPAIITLAGLLVGGGLLIYWIRSGAPGASAVVPA